MILELFNELSFLDQLKNKHFSLLILGQKSWFLGPTIVEVLNRIDIKYIAYYHLHYKTEQLQE